MQAALVMMVGEESSSTNLRAFFSSVYNSGDEIFILSSSASVERVDKKMEKRPINDITIRYAAQK